MRMTRKELHDLTWKEFCFSLLGFEELESERVIENRTMARMMAYYSAAPHTKIRDFKQIMLLPGEHRTTRSPEELKKRCEEHAKRAQAYFATHKN